MAWITPDRFHFVRCARPPQRLSPPRWPCRPAHPRPRRTRQPTTWNRRPVSRAFVLEDGRFTGFGVHGAVRTEAYDITNKGQVIGQYDDADDGEQHGFTRDKRGGITTVDFPGVDGSLNESIGGNDHGEIGGKLRQLRPRRGRVARVCAGSQGPVHHQRLPRRSRERQLQEQQPRAGRG
jgi:hypothetical protein